VAHQASGKLPELDRGLRKEERLIRLISMVFPLPPFLLLFCGFYLEVCATSYLRLSLYDKLFNTVTSYDVAKKC